MLFAFIVLASASACCMRRIESEPFRALPLDAQLATYKEARAKGCIVSYLSLLSAISDHGLASADAMNSALQSPEPGMPLEDVLIVLRFVQSGGTDLRQHAALPRLERLLEITQDPDLRSDLEKTIAQLKTAPRPR